MTAKLLTFIPILCIAVATKSISQLQTRTIQIGDTMPDLQFNRVLNYAKNDFKLYELKGKKIIIDFWSRSCPSCIASFPHTEKLQSIFGDSLKIFTITESDFKEYNILKNRSKILQQSKLPFILEGKTLFQMMSPPNLPYVIWLNEQGVLVATSKGSSLTQKNVRRFLLGEKLDLTYRKTEMGNVKIISTASKLVAKRNDSIVYFSALEKQFKNEYSPGVKYLRNSREGLGIEIVDNTLSSLFCLAYQFPYPQYITTEDTELEYIIRPREEAKLEDWRSGVTYNYLLRFQPNKYYEQEQHVLSSCMQKDLSEILGIRAVKRKVIKQVLLLKFISDSMKIATSNMSNYSVLENTKKGIFIRNNPISFLARQLEYWINKGNNNNYFPVFDETNFEGKVDIDLEFKNNDLLSINRSLKKVNLVLIQGKREIEQLFLVRSKSPSTPSTTSLKEGSSYPE